MAKYSAMLTPAAKILMKQAVERVKAHYAPVLAVWSSATREQREKFLSNSPLLAELLDILRPFIEVK